VSVHIPKTSGTTPLKAVLEPGYGKRPLRDYVDKPLSRPIAERNAHALTLEEFYELEQFHNLYAKYLWSFDLDEFGFVGITSRSWRVSRSFGGALRFRTAACPRRTSIPPRQSLIITQSRTAFAVASR
jgi:hypothetical protein